MRVGVISDIHNNVVALNAILDALHEEKCEQIICCGDIIGIGPYPEETVQRLIQIPDIVAVRGNHERYLLEDMPTLVPNEEQMGYDEMEHHKWEHALLSDQSVEFLKGLPYRADINLCGLHIVVLHYGMDTTNRYVDYMPHPNLDDCHQMFLNIESDVVLYGHDHRMAVNQDKYRLYANCGALGRPAKDIDLARAGILSTNNGKVTYETIKVPYDIDRVIAEINLLAYPASEEIKRIFYGIK
ncbi:MAG: metallophosphoesterase family protein [Anaerolineae bacterium]